MPHIEFLVEEPSMEAALRNLVPRILGEDSPFVVHVHAGKPDLLKNLPDRLRGYKAWLPEDWRIVILIDEDRENCKELKADLEKAAKNAGLITQSAAGAGARFQVLNRVAIEELEAWFFGDVQALVSAYPGVSSTLGEKARFRNPDDIKGGTWEALEQVLQKAGYHLGGLNKITAAREISRHMDPQHNRSKSFQMFRKGLLEMRRWVP